MSKGEPRSDFCLRRTSPIALMSKRSAVVQGYYEDEYIHIFADYIKNTPVINMMYYSRVVSIRKALTKIMESFQNETVQFVNLGCGLDTITFWMLKKYQNIICFELDFSSTMEHKADIIKNAQPILDLIGEHTFSNNLINSRKYTMLSIDLRDIDTFRNFIKSGLSDQLPTIFLSEVSLVYIKNDISNEIIKICSTATSKPSCFVFLEHFRPLDPYAKYFFNKFKECGLTLYAPNDYPTVALQEKRYTDLGWEKSAFRDANFIYNNLIEEEERIRIRKLEILDEIEELVLAFAHYGMGVASNKMDTISDVYDLFMEKESEDKVKSYAIDEVREMVSNGTLYKMQPSVSRLAPFSKFFSDIIANDESNNK